MAKTGHGFCLLARLSWTCRTWTALGWGPDAGRRNVSLGPARCWPRLVFWGNVSKAALLEITSFANNLGKSSFCFWSKNLENQNRQIATCERRQGTGDVQGCRSLMRLRSRHCRSGYTQMTTSMRKATWSHLATRWPQMCPRLCSHPVSSWSWRPHSPAGRQRAVEAVLTDPCTPCRPHHLQVLFGAVCGGSREERG